MCERCGCNPLGRSGVYEFLALGFAVPEPALLDLMRQQLTRAAAYLEASEAGGSLGAIKALAPALACLTAAGLEEAYVRCFGHTISKECPPYEAEYGQAHIFQQTQALADIAGFYRAFGLDLAPSLKDRLDHIAVELEFMQFLCLKEAYAQANRHSEDRLAMCREVQRKFLGEHLGGWAVEFGRRLEQKSTGGFYRDMGKLLAEFLALDMGSLGLAPGQVGGTVYPEPSEEPTPGCDACPLLIAGAGRGAEP